MDIRETREDGVLVLAPDGSLASAEDTSAFESRLAAAIKGGSRQVAVDCRAVGQMTSPAIRALLGASRKLGRAQGRLVLFGMNAKVKKAFSISGFDKDFFVTETSEDAMRLVREPVDREPSKLPARPAPEVASPPPSPPPPPPPTPPALAPVAPVTDLVPSSVAVPAPPEPVAARPESPVDAAASALLALLGFAGELAPAAPVSADRARALERVADSLLSTLGVSPH